MVLPPGEYAGFAYQGSPLHVHHENDEWLYILEGTFVAEVGGVRYRLTTGDSLLLPMRIPHRWSPAGGTRFGAMHQYTPAGKMDVFFDDPAVEPKEPPTQAEMEAEFAKCGMTLLGPPLTKEEIDKVQ
jgi:mannose-6-phosphate isomerase-like protein (cupin superfamily)